MARPNAWMHGTAKQRMVIRLLALTGLTLGAIPALADVTYQTPLSASLVDKIASTDLILGTEDDLGPEDNPFFDGFNSEGSSGYITWFDNRCPLNNLLAGLCNDTPAPAFGRYCMVLAYLARNVMTKL